ncbi:Ww domain-containing isoform 1 [Haematococcus lacustris]|uniref:Ww domain-containing isoform 1 n=1 Tax=Haematococcus lacustris TaxID=44745 RepID=A0A699YEP1_HAELA|nr:Ww domain-containing isoform 1 [Haematococcus lacustris]
MRKKRAAVVSAAPTTSTPVTASTAAAGSGGAASTAAAAAGPAAALSSAGSSSVGSGGGGVVRQHKKARLSTGVRKVDALVSQWQSVAKKLARDEALEQRKAELATDPKAVEKRRLREAEKWAAAQRASAEAADNANFTPVQGDWRQTLAKLGSPH